MVKTITIQGNKIHDIPSFYEHINELFMRGVDWNLGQSLDALNDLLYGGYGIIEGNEAINLIWLNFEKNRVDLGYELTLEHYQKKLLKPSVFNIDFIQSKIDELQQGKGMTYFEIILEIISEHTNITLIPK
ncbi:ribonuclease inhibitor [Sphingobacterium shayense]|uniref:ribonuclease inhibitor n=1 Tax=Sphingobacterium shayense TaxID=626343 RepID=UPI0015562088|nr:ribonuclease inhibitor [Sphingobacterium shayense]NQD71941.1 ribonuclease inhibitor [Sphingobacterium shayense]